MPPRAARVAPTPAIEYGELLRKVSLWFACRARREGHRYIPDDQGNTLMYFPTEESLLRYFKGFRRKAINVDARELAAARTVWLREHDIDGLDEF